MSEIIGIVDEEKQLNRKNSDQESKRFIDTSKPQNPLGEMLADYSRTQLYELLKSRSEIINSVALKPYCMVSMRSHFNGRQYIGYGFSKVQWPDEFSPTEGANKCWRRALREIVKKVREVEK